MNSMRVSQTQTGIQPNLLYAHKFLQPVIGSRIYFDGGGDGCLRKVIIDPNNRRVISMVIQGVFPELQFKQQSSADKNMLTTTEQSIVIPMTIVRHLNSTSGYLTIQAHQVDWPMILNDAHYTVPGPWWKAPYPYHPEDVLFPITKQAAIFHHPNPDRQEQLWDDLLVNDSLGG
jgi:hypothetical protein